MFYRFALGALLLVNSLSIFGYATFSRNTQLLISYPWAQPIFENAYWVFARFQILLALLAMLFLLHEKVNGKWVPAFITAVLISLGSEFSGTTWGLPFGSYEYTDLLGPTLFGRVPYLIPVSWFFMGIASYGIANSIVSFRGFSFMRLILASWTLMSWDLTLDPAMSHLAPFWTWNEAGPYFGTPLLNLAGWYVTGLFIMLSFEVLRVNRWIGLVPTQSLVAFYGANLALPVGIVVAAGLWEAVVVSVLCFSIIFFVFIYRRFFWTPPLMNQLLV
ncbi:MAG: carotenoid biosynthesis protein [Pseudomonadota bacterium]